MARTVVPSLRCSRWRRRTSHRLRGCRKQSAMPPLSPRDGHMLFEGCSQPSLVASSSLRLAGAIGRHSCRSDSSWAPLDSWRLWSAGSRSVSSWPETEGLTRRDPGRIRTTHRRTEDLYCHDAAMEPFSGSSDLVPPDDVAPEQVPQQCSLCDSADPQWRYRVEATQGDQGRVLGGRALARWWPACTECHHLIAAGSVQSLLERIANRTRPLASDIASEFVRRAQPWGHTGSPR
jgi:hypothetical protein